MIRRILLLSCALACAGAEIQRYATRLDLALEGPAAATATVTATGAPGESFQIPVGFKASGLRLVEGPAGLLLEPAHNAVRATLPPAGGPCTFTFAFSAEGVFWKEVLRNGQKPTIPATSRLVRHAFVNTEVAVIKDYSVEASLPAGYRFQGVKEALPKTTKADIEPRVRLGRTAGRETALLRLEDADQGDSASMVLEAVPRDRSLLWLLFGAGIAALYLVLFRDMVSAKS